MDKNLSPYFTHLKCRECGRQVPEGRPCMCATSTLAPWRPPTITTPSASVLTRKVIEGREESMWRYRELLPIDGEPTVGTQVGFTPLVKADRLARNGWGCGSFISRMTR